MAEGHTHRVVGKPHRRAGAIEGVTEPYVEYAVGDPITPTDAELRSMPFRFEPLDAEPERVDEPATGELTQDAIDAADYPTLRSLAAEFDDISGNWSEAKIRSALSRKVGGA